MRIVQVTQPAIEPVDLATAKLHIRQDVDDDDTLIAGLIQAARKVCEARSHLCFITQTFDLFFDSWGCGIPGSGYGSWGSFGSSFFMGQTTGSTLYQSRSYDRLALPHGPVQSVASVKYVDQSGALQTLDPSVYIVSTGNPGRISLKQNQSFPSLACQADAVQVRYTAGYGDTADSVPQAAVSAILLLVGHLYRIRAASGESMDVVPFGVDELLASISCGAGLFA